MYFSFPPNLYSYNILPYENLSFQVVRIIYAALGALVFSFVSIVVLYVNM